MIPDVQEKYTVPWHKRVNDMILVFLNNENNNFRELIRERKCTINKYNNKSKFTTPNVDSAKKSSF